MNYRLGKKIKETVEKWTGIKVSVGVAPTKVLAKLANHIAKKDKKAIRLCYGTGYKAEKIKSFATNKAWKYMGSGRSICT